MRHTLSIAMAVKDGERYLEQQLHSIRAQTLPPDELVICDDNSCDGSREILKKFRSAAPFPVKIYENPTTLGSTPNFLKAISHCRGSLIKICDQDDYWEADCLKEIVRVFHSTPAVGLVISNANVVDERLEPLGYSLWEARGFNKKLQRQLSSPFPWRVMLKHNVGYGFTLTFQSRFVPYFNNLPASWPYDGWIAFTIAALAGVGIIPQPLIRYRQHAAQQKPFRVKKEERKKGAFLRIERESLEREIKLFQDALNYYEKIEPQTFSGLSASLRLKLQHSRFRLNIPSSRSKRLFPILQQILHGHYHHFSNGWRSAARDLLRPL